MRYEAGLEQILNIKFLFIDGDKERHFVMSMSTSWVAKIVFIHV